MADRTPDPASAARPGLRLTVLLGENDQYHHRPLYAEIVHRAHRAGLAGASVFKGIEGFGAHSLVHTQRLLSLSENLPVAVVVVDSEERVREFLPQLQGLVPEGTAVLDACEIVSLAQEAGAGSPHDSRAGEEPGEAPGTETETGGQSGA